ncbi:MAG: hypothetical protein JJU22_18300, partial [Gammaproteobacteria bacterium]|nr:hypothetical protein [Gammaproteobacteria bacterium]
MHHVALEIRSTDLSAEARLVLFRLLAHFGPGGSPPQYLRTLLETILVPYGLGSSALDELVEEGQLLKQGVERSRSAAEKSRHSIGS